MSLSVGELIAYLKLDMTQYSTALREAKTKSATATREMSAGFKNLESAVGRVEAKLRGIGSNSGIGTLARDLQKLKAASSGLKDSEVTRMVSAIRKLGQSTNGLGTAIGELKRMQTAVSAISKAMGATSGLREFASALRGLAHLGTAGASEEIKQLASGIRALIKTANSIPALRALAAALRDLASAGHGLGSLGNVGNSLRGMQSQIDQLRRSIAGLRNAGGSGGGGRGILSSLIPSGGVGTLLTFAAAVREVGRAFVDTAKVTADFETDINVFGAVNKISGDSLKPVTDLAIQLGGDLTIAGANASDAAQSMLELSKGGLSVSESMTAAKGSLQLASAGGLDFARAADIQTSAMASFQLGADKAGEVADTLANTANAARGNVSDFAEALKYSGATAHLAGWSLEDTNTMLALFARNGLTASVGGATLNTMLVRMMKLTKPAAQAVEDLGLTLYDSEHHFITARQLTDQLAQAKARMNDEDFNAAIGTLGGTRAIRGLADAALEGADGYDKMNTKIHEGAGAAAFSEAKMKGLGGSFANFQNQVETAQVVLGEKFSPALTGVINKLSTFVPQVTSWLGKLDFSGISGKIGAVFDPLVKSAGELISRAWPYVQSFLSNIGKAVSSVLTFLAPVSKGIQDFVKGFQDSGTVDALGKALDGLGIAVSAVAKFLSPLGGVLGTVIGWLGKIPGPVWAGVAAIGAFLVLRGPLSAMLLQAIAGYARLFLTLKGVTGAGMLSGLKSLGSGLLSAFGGGIGIAIGLITTALFFWIQANQKAKQAAEEHQQAITDLATTIDQVTGQLSGDSLKKITDGWVESGVADKFKDIGAGAGEAAGAIVKGGSAIDDYRKKILAAAGGWDVYSTHTDKAQVNIDRFKDEAKQLGMSADDLVVKVLAGGPAFDQLAQKLYDTAKANGDTNVSLEGMKEGLTDIVGGLDPAVNGLYDFNNQVSTVNGAVDQTTSKFKTAATAVATLTGIDATRLTNSLIEVAKGGGTVEDSLANMNVTGDAAKKVIDTFGTSIYKGADGLHYMSQAAADAATSLGVAGSNTFASGIKIEGAFRNSSDAANNLATAGGDVTGVATDMSGALDDVGDSADEAKEPIDSVADAISAIGTEAGRADTLTQFLQITLDKLAGRNTDAAAATRANAAAVRQIAQDSRDLASAQDNVTATQLKLNEAQNKGTDENYSAEQKTLDVADAERAHEKAIADVQAAMDGQKDSYDKLAESATGQVTASYSAILGTKGYNAAVKAATAEMAKQRKAFIDTQPAADIASGAADKLADSLGLIPANVKTSFDAETHVAQKNGEELYRVYNRTTGKWEGRFVTANDAVALRTAGNIVQVYDKAKGTWTANLEAIDNASGKIDAVGKSLAALHNKEISLTVNASGQSVSVRADGSFVTGAGKVGWAEGGAIQDGPKGYLRGPGGPKSDSIIARVANTEFVSTGVSTQKNRDALDAGNRGAKLIAVPGFANGGYLGHAGASVQTNINYVGGNPAAEPINRMNAVYSVMDSAVSVAQLANAAMAKAIEEQKKAAAAAATGGVAQWVPLMIKVITEKLGANAVASVLPVMSAQMKNESGGNPRAINLTDSNAQAGHPSVGLLQFIPTTFAANADPGYNSDIYDPESQMRAFINYVPRNYGSFDYLTRHGNGAYAEGGAVRGGRPGVDSVHALLMPDEHVLDTDDVKNMGGQAAVYDFRNQLKSSGLKKMATGGSVGDIPGNRSFVANGSLARALAGYIAPVFDTMRQAFQDALSQIGEIRSSYMDKLTDARSGVGDAHQREADARGKLHDTVDDAKQRQSSARESVNEAQQKVNAAAAQQRAAKTAAAHRAANKARDIANSQLTKQTDIYNKVVKTTNSEIQSRIRAVNGTMAGVKAAQAAEKAAFNQVRAIDKAIAATGKYQQRQAAVATQLDKVNAKLANAKDALANLRDTASQFRSGVSSNLQNTGGGITALADKRTTGDDVLRGAKHNLDTLIKYQQDINKLKKLGLNNTDFQDIIDKGVDGGAATADALANSSKAQIDQINSVRNKIHAYSEDIAKTATDKMYGAGIAAAQGLVNGLASQQKTLEKQMVSLANIIAGAIKKALGIHSPSRRMHNEVGIPIIQGMITGMHSQRDLLTSSAKKIAGNAVATVNSTPISSFDIRSSNSHMARPSGTIVLSPEAVDQIAEASRQGALAGTSNMKMIQNARGTWALDRRADLSQSRK